LLRIPAGLLLWHPCTRTWLHCRLEHSRRSIWGGSETETDSRPTTTDKVPRCSSRR
jgi:hypothetical protein